MTTSWAHAVRGHWLQAAKANSGGALLAAITMLAVPWLLLSAVCGRWLTRPPSDRELAGLAVGVVTITILDWIYRLSAG